MGRDNPVPYPHMWVSDSAGYRYMKNRNRCIICGVECQGRRSTFCSKGCLAKYFSFYVWTGIKARIQERDNYTCQDCGWKVNDSENYKHKPRHLHVHHIKPVCEGGKSTDDNLITLCNFCHRRWHRRGLKQTVTLDNYINNRNKQMFIKYKRWR